MHVYIYSFFSCYIIFLAGCREKQLPCIIVLWMVVGVFPDRLGDLQKIKWRDCKI